MLVQFRDYKAATGDVALALAREDFDESFLCTIAARRERRRDPLVLIADDDGISRMLAGNAIGRDYRCIYADTGRRALQEYVEQAPDAVLLDIGISDISGHEIMACLNKIDPEGYVIMFSRYHDESNVIRAINEGARGFLIKPFTRNKIYQYLRRSPHLLQKQDASPRRKRVSF